ncbi:MAG: hypothetical protein OEN02_01225 [Gammaproteobacteria bacterium]|nr:hypothetical protein [Gammaproteobacteria bacterium]MDH3536055.1 hypothetical protein [Gammaproteobacteria bacterium]
MGSDSYFLDFGAMLQCDFSMIFQAILFSMAWPLVSYQSLKTGFNWSQLQRVQSGTLSEEPAILRSAPDFVRLYRSNVESVKY